MQRALEASVRLIDSTRRAVARSERCAHRRPVRTTLELQAVSTKLQDASARLVRATEELVATNACLWREYGRLDAVREVLDDEAARCVAVMASLRETADELFSLQDELMFGLESGAILPEAPRGPRIRLAPRPVPIRAFLVLRQPRVVDRIAPILRRRRRTPRPASIRVPRRTILDRAPPLVSISLR